MKDRMTLRKVDSKGRITLAPEYANGTMLVDVREDGSILMRPASVKVVPDDHWLRKNKAAFASVQRGLAQGRARKFVKGPDLKRARELAEAMVDE